MPPPDPGGRTALRPLATTDAAAIRRIYGPGAVRHLPRPPMDARQADAWLARHLRERPGPWRLTTWGITAGPAAVPHEKPPLIGVIRLVRRARYAAEIAFILHEDVWGRGHATRALALVLPRAFDDLDLIILRARHHRDNTAARRVLTRAGFVLREATEDQVTCLHTRGAWQAATDPWSTLLPG
ncbi:GNAT family N-acetyltransferase [Streptomyces radicis]|uniref:GNAT family N-acetyltransferase n=1 Tax=Streptomyces radicis TaxID=1750517 RepID=UPI00160493FF|nr:GNAT family N-acetyltransferase [Streptomyces radicis]